MLGRNSYPKSYVKECRRLVDDQVAAYEAVVKTAGPKGKAALAAFEPRHFNSMVLVLDQLFVHRLRGVEGKDGNPLNEVRLLCTAVMEHDGVLAADTQLKLDPAKSITGLKVGDRVELTAADFVRLSDAFFAEIGKRFA